MVDDYATRVIQIRIFRSGEYEIRWDETEIATRLAEKEQKKVMDQKRGQKINIHSQMWRGGSTRILPF